MTLDLDQLTVTSFDTSDPAIALPVGFYSSCVPGECQTVEYQGCTGLNGDTWTEPVGF